jgi:UDP-N-acetyl-D-glucosamine dehydrogenase
MDTVSICVPTPLRKTKDPDLTFILSALDQIKPRLHRQQLIVLESTTYPGTTEELVLPKLEETGLVVGEDFYLAFSPERVDPGNATYTTRNIPKVVGGVTPTCTRLAAQLFACAVERVVPVSSTRVAEMVKLLENTFRSVNIGLVNELALLSDRMGIDVWEVIDAAATKPFGFMPFYPGPGLGGHCIPIDPFYLTWKAREYGQHTRFIELAGEINTSMPEYVVNRVAEALNSRRKALNGSSVLVLGIAYKANVDDDRESPSYVLMDLLKKRGAEVSYYDPYIPVIRPSREHSHWAGTRSVSWTKEALRKFDVVLISTNHEAVNYQELADSADCIVDTRNAMAGIKARPGQVWKA